MEKNRLNKKYPWVLVHTQKGYESVKVKMPFYVYLRKLCLNLSESIEKDQFDIYMQDYEKATGDNPIYKGNAPTNHRGIK
jgi:hypothetical protein